MTDRATKLQAYEAAHNCVQPKNDKQENRLLLVFAKGQVISKGFFGVFNIFQKTNKNTLHSSKSEFIWKNSQLDNLLSKLTDL